MIAGDVGLPQVLKPIKASEMVFPSYKATTESEGSASLLHHSLFQPRKILRDKGTLNADLATNVCDEISESVRLQGRRYCGHVVIKWLEAVPVCGVGKKAAEQEGVN